MPQAKFLRQCAANAVARLSALAATPCHVENGGKVHYCYVPRSRVDRIWKRFLRSDWEASR